MPSPAGAKAEPDVDAAGSNHGIGEIRINPGGGVAADGSDGLRFTVLEVDGGEGHRYRNQSQYYSDNVTAILSIGGYAYAEHVVGAPFSDVELVSLSGSATNSLPSSATGSGSVVLRYTVQRYLKTFEMLRTISYTYPNDYVTQTFEVTIPLGNAEPVKLYYGGDTAPGGSDSGYGIMITSPVRSVISLNQFSLVQLGIREAPGSEPFDGATARSYSTPDGAVAGGGNIGFVATGSNHHAGLMTQWTLGSVPGSYTLVSEQFANVQGVTLSAAFRDSTIAEGTDATLDLNLVNTNLSQSSGLGFSFDLPSGLVVAAGSSTSDCGGTLTAAAGSSNILLVGASVSAAANCLASVPVTPAAGAYVIGPGSVSSITGLFNRVGTSTLTVTGTPQALAWQDDAISTPTQGKAYNDGLSTTGYPAATYSVSAGALPAGLSLDTNTGGIVGTPQNGDAYDFTITASNGSGPDISLRFTGMVATPTAPVWTDFTISSFFRGVQYSEGVSASGAPAPTYSVSDGSLPAGITLNSNTGALSGTPTEDAGTPFDFTITASNSVDPAVSQRYQYEIQAYIEPNWTDQQVATGSVGTVYSDGVSAESASTYEVSDGSLPPGLSLDGSTGAITGTPTAAGTYDFTVKATNTVPFITAAVSIVVAPGADPPAVAPPVAAPPGATPPAYECPTAPILVTGVNREASGVAWYVCRMHLVAGDWQGALQFVLLPRGWFHCPNPPQRRWYQRGNEFGGWVLQHHCGYEATIARARFGPWFAWNPPGPNPWWRMVWADSRTSL